MIGYLSEVSRTFLFTTAPSPVAAAAALQALRIMRSEPERLERLWDNAATLHGCLSQLGFAVPGTVSPIIPLTFADPAQARKTGNPTQEPRYLRTRHSSSIRSSGNI